MAEKMLGTIPALLLALFFGPWSDIHGRKLPLLLPYIGNIVAVVMFLLGHYLQVTPVTLLIMAGFLARALSGHFILVHLISFSYVADLVRTAGSYEEIGVSGKRGRAGEAGRRAGGQRAGPEAAGTDSGEYEEIRQEPLWRDAAALPARREKVDQGELMAGMTRLQVAETLGIVSGAVMGWGFQKAGGSPLSFGVGALILTAGMLVVILWMKEVHDPLRTQRTASTAANASSESAPKRALKNLARMLNCKKLDVDPMLLWGCSLIMFLMFAVREGRAAITVPFIQQPPLSWPNARLSAYIAVYSIAQSVFLFVVAPFMKDRNVVIVSLLGATVGGIWVALSTVTWSLMVAGCFSHMTDCIFPALRAILSRNLAQSQVGEVLSRMSAAEALSTIVGPLAVVHLYNRTNDYFPGTAFLATAAVPAAILLVGAVVEAFYEPKVRPLGQSEVPELDARDASQRPDFTQSLNVPSATASGYGLFWCSSQW